MNPLHVVLLLTASLMAAAPAQDKPPVIGPPVQDPPGKILDEDDEKPPVEKVTIKETEFKLQISADPVTRANGLMGREELNDDEGMIFVYPRPGIRNYWMKNCVIDIDIIYVNPRGRITAMHEMKIPPPRKAGESNWDYEARLPRYSSKRMAQYAIELKAGTLKKLKLKVGDIIELDRRKLVRMAR